ncbi:hypothetical protein FJ366_02130 [Candidatus Dependentiae bacterium]|nr:hypothetical protein [Candidatus Dependentiae bacterium]
MFLKKITLLVIMTGAAGLLHGLQPTDTENAIRQSIQEKLTEWATWPNNSGQAEALHSLKLRIQYIERNAANEAFKLSTYDDASFDGAVWNELMTYCLRRNTDTAYTEEECDTIANNLKEYYNEIATAHELPQYQD